MIIGYRKLKDCQPGQLVRLRNGTYVLLTEYHTFNGGNGHTLDAYFVDSGECMHAKPDDADDWVAIIDMQAIEVEIDTKEYPDNPYWPKEAVE